MGLFKEVKKPVIKTATAGAQISPLRPRYVQKVAPCIATCPCGTDIRGWVTTIAQAEAYGHTADQAFELAWYTITDRNPFPAICGRVCPHPCEDACNRTAKEGAVEINALERVVGDFGLEHGLKLKPLEGESAPDGKVAIIGSGPAGLSCAYQLARRGYPVTVFEAFDRPGGMLRYGIPPYRLPRAVLDAEIARIVDLGVELKCRTAVGRDVSLEEVRKNYAAIFVGIGAHKGLTLRVPGEDASNVLTGTEFLNRVNTGEAVTVGSHVVVVGGGDTAIDAARVSRRLGAEVTILYRRTRAEMPAIAPEIDGALEEGVKLELLAAPVEVLRSNGAATGVRCIRMDLGEPDASGRPRPVPRPGSEFDLSATTIIAAIGQKPNTAGFDGLDDHGWIRAGDNGQTPTDAVYAGGDDVELGLVTTAIAQGRFAAEAIDARLRGQQLDPRVPPNPIKPDKMKSGGTRKHRPTSCRTCPSPSGRWTRRWTWGWGPRTRSRRPSGACRAGSAWTARPAGCTARTPVS